MGIGTSSPSGLAHLSQAGGADTMLVLENTSGTNPFQVGQGNDDSLRFYYNASEKMRLDSSGNVGIGRTPTVVESAYDSIQLGAGGMYLAGSSNLAAGQLGQNFYADASGNIKYLGNDEAERITFNNGIITFDNAPANTSGAGAALTFNERMRIDASGALLLHPNNSTRGLKITSTTNWHSRRYNNLRYNSRRIRKARF